MAAKRSAGILLFRKTDNGPEILLGHMGGPFWARKDDHAWSLVKGEHLDDEEPETAARREFQEELGLPLPEGDLVALGEVKQSGGKVVTAWAVRGDLDPADVVPGTFEMEWPPKSGQVKEFPELDRVEWFGLEEARTKIVKGQAVFLDRLVALPEG
ncbi:NUDIX domain-containing protein [Umezawaea sp. Da 62-37]|uniref:NUDIX domain-containing protein n=1 Tax=Umezawaea sp. Da 62-37 TaxID=3075927 RepID=UPI0028F7460C|nr:NUDIX domain-containing protein [Umezawaea sp. Da 62-37]WNV89492.1 NUDIX domain-containing protein [Umezawaea sp. Da 62-37]